MLGSRKITATLAGEILEGSVINSCPHGRVLLPLLCSLVKDKLITGPSDLMRVGVIHWDMQMILLP
jgi:hypothetical protein